MALAGAPERCPVCGEEAPRLFSPVPMLGRQKPRGFKWDKGRLNGWEDRVATLRDMENRGPREFRKFKESIGGTLYDATLKYKRQAHG